MRPEGGLLLQEKFELSKALLLQLTLADPLMVKSLEKTLQDFTKFRNKTIDRITKP
jgi:hypothetical protein